MPNISGPDISGISVIIPAHNAEKTLARALDSVMAQGPGAPDLDVIVIDDASRDATHAIAAQYAQRMPLRLIPHTQQRGVAAAMNRGAQAARHDLLAFLDADDAWKPGKLAAQCAALKAMPKATIIATAFAAIMPGGRVLYTYGETPFPEAPDRFWLCLLKDAAIKKSSSLVPRRLFEAVGGFDEARIVAEDQDLFLRLAGQGPVAYVHDILTFYHLEPHSLTRKGIVYDLDHVLPMIEKYLKLFANRMTRAEIRTVRAIRYRAAAENLLWVGQWRAAWNPMRIAIANGANRSGCLWRLAKGAPPVRALKKLWRTCLAPLHRSPLHQKDTL